MLGYGLIGILVIICLVCGSYARCKRNRIGEPALSQVLAIPVTSAESPLALPPWVSFVGSVCCDGDIILRLRVL
jgi:hypothetical protein